MIKPKDISIKWAIDCLFLFYGLSTISGLFKTDIYFGLLEFYFTINISLNTFER